MNAKQAERKLRDLFRRKPEIKQPGRLLAHLANEIGERPTAQCLDAVATALIEMERKGDIRIGKTGRHPDCVRYIAVPTPATPTSTPSQDDQPKEVNGMEESQGTDSDIVVTDTEPAPAHHAVAQLRELSKVDQANGCLKVLTELATNGIGEGLSVRNVLLELTDLSASQVSYAQNLLMHCGCYATEMTGFQTSTYTLDLSKSEVTEADWEQFKAQKRSVKADEPGQEAATAEPAEPTALERPSTSVEVDLDDQLVRLVESQAVQIGELQQLAEDQAAALVQLADERNALQEQLERKSSSADEIEQLRKQCELLGAELTVLKDKEAARTKRAQELVARYGTQ